MKYCPPHSTEQGGQTVKDETVQSEFCDSALNDGYIIESDAAVAVCISVNLSGGSQGDAVILGAVAGEHNRVRHINRTAAIRAAAKKSWMPLTASSCLPAGKI